MIKHNLTEENYFSRENELKYMGVSQYKSFTKCEASALAQVEGEWKFEPTKAMLIGSYVDAVLLGGLDQFLKDNPDVFKKDGALKAEYEHGNRIVERVLRDKQFVKALVGRHQVIQVGVIEGVPVKTKIDIMQRNRTTDLKCMRDFEDAWVDGEKLPWWKAWRYDIQGGVYQEVRRQNDRKGIKPFGFAAITKEPEPDYGLFEVPQDVLNLALQEVKHNIVYFDGIKKGLFEPIRCEKCDYCRSTKKLTGWEELKLLEAH